MQIHAYIISRSTMRGSANILHEIKFIKWIKHYNNNSLHKRRSMPAIYIS